MVVVVERKEVQCGPIPSREKVAIRPGPLALARGYSLIM